MSSSFYISDSFIDRLSGQKCMVEEYAHSQKVWEQYECEASLNYIGLYLLTHVSLLARKIW